MAKQKKKRNKVYRGKDAAITQPLVTRVSAANRNKLQQYIFERRQLIRPVLIAAGVIVVIVILIIGIVQLVSGH